MYVCVTLVVKLVNVPLFVSNNSGITVQNGGSNPPYLNGKCLRVRQIVFIFNDGSMADCLGR